MFKWLKKLFIKQNTFDLLTDFGDIDPKKHGIYTMGSPDPRCFTRGYNSWSGVDVKVHFDGKRLGYVQGISFDSIAKRGTMVAILFDCASEIQKDLFVGPARLFLTAANEYGALGVLFDGIVEFEGEQWGISIDDIITDKSHPFKIHEYVMPTSIHPKDRCMWCGCDLPCKNEMHEFEREEVKKLNLKCICRECEEKE